jgi:hypothetical protein
VAELDLRPELPGVAGVPETVLSERLLARLPLDAPPAPWTVTAEAVVWYARGSPAATAALPPALRDDASGLAVVGGVVRYHDTPVGRYDEVFGMVGSRSRFTPWGSVAFMAVSSEASLVGGRAHWAMPKTLSTFDGEIGSGERITATGADEVRWTVDVTPTAYGPSLPVRSSGRCRQQFPDGSVGESRMRGRARMRPALVEVDVDSEGPLAGWLRPGRHLGAVISSATFSLSEPEPLFD